MLGVRDHLTLADSLSSRAGSLDPDGRGRMARGPFFSVKVGWPSFFHQVYF